jgi:hypothetical protein
VQPLVFTNLHWFNGWRSDGIPVLSRNGLNSILNGGVATYENMRGHVMDRQSFSDGGTTGESFLQLLKIPM